MISKILNNTYKSGLDSGLFSDECSPSLISSAGEMLSIDVSLVLFRFDVSLRPGGSLGRGLSNDTFAFTGGS